MPTDLDIWQVSTLANNMKSVREKKNLENVLINIDLLLWIFMGFYLNSKNLICILFFSLADMCIKVLHENGNTPGASKVVKW